MKRRKLFVSIIAGLMAAIMLLGLIVSILPTPARAASSGEIQAQIDELQDQNAELEAELEALSAKKAENYNEIKDIVAQKYNIEQQVNLLFRQVENVNQQIAAMNTMIADKQEEIDFAQARFDELNAKNKERIRAMEEEGKLSYWSVLFKANSFADFLDRLNMINEIAAADNRRIQELSDAAQELEEAKQTMEVEKVNLEYAKEDLKNKEAELDEKKEEAQEMINLLLEREAEYMAMMEEADAAKAALIDEIGQLQIEYEEAKQREWEEYMATMTTEATTKATTPDDPDDPDDGEDDDPTPSGPYDNDDEGWICPCYYVCVTDPYGWRYHPFGGYESFHSGVDLAAAEGTPIYAAKSGYVTTAVYHWSFGNYVSISHGSGWSSMYAHMMYSVVSAGEYVYQGQLIGYMGETGEATGPHLHFVIYYNGSTVNPMDYI